jgi:hypothetical protein
MMKHISHGRGRICGTPAPERGGYVSDEEWLKLPECPECFAKAYRYDRKTTLHTDKGLDKAPQEVSVYKREEQPTIKKQGLYLRYYLED